jgi:hypothetical protein
MNVKKIQFLMGGGAVYSAEYQAVLDYATAHSIEKPVAVDRLAEDVLVKLLVSSGAWALCDQIFNLSAAGDRNFALINMKNPGTINGTESATVPLWSKGKGFRSSGTQYIKSGFIPLNGVNYTQNNAGIYFTVANAIGTSGSFGELGANDSGFTKALILSVLNASSNFVAYINSDGPVFNSSNTGGTALGRYAVSRSASNLTKVYKNGSQIGSNSVVVSTGLSAKEVYVCGYNNNGSAAGLSTRIIGFWLVSSNLNAVIAALDSAVNSFLTTNISVTVPSFPDKTNFNNYLTAISQLSFSYSEPSQELIAIGYGVDCYGGALAANGCIYCSPGGSTFAFKINTSSGALSQVGSFVVGTFKYGGAVHVNGIIYLIPSSSTVVGKIDTSTDTLTFFDSSGVKGTESGNLSATSQKYYGGFKGQDGRIYCVPYNATSVLIIDPSNDSISYIDTTGVLPDYNGNMATSGKWDTGVNCGDYIYGTPSDATDILKINSVNGTCQRLGSFPVGTAKWAIGLVSPNGYIYFFPYSDYRIVKYNPADDTYAYLAAEISDSGHAQTKILAAKLMPNGKVVLISYDVIFPNNYVLDFSNDSLTAFKRISLDPTNSCVITANGDIYGVPQGASNLLKLSFPRRTISLPDNFTDNNYIQGY